MADRLTQLQEAVNRQAENFTNSLGVLQQFATPTPLPLGKDGKKISAKKEQDQQQQQFEDHTALFAQLIARTAKDIEVLIDSLPNEESSAELQSASLKKLEDENKDSAENLEKVVKQGEAILQEVQSALHDIANSQLEIQRLESKNLD